jgi:hypothetical protein
MKYIKVWGIPVPVIVSDLRDHDAKSMGLWIAVRREGIHDEGLLQHEAVHIRQGLRTFGLHFLLYARSSKYRYKSECEAHARQLKFGLSSAEAVRRIMSNYNLDALRLNEVMVHADLMKFS